MSKFITNLAIDYLTDAVFEVTKPLVYESDILKCTITVPVCFQSDGASVPRIPFIYELFGNKAHHEAVIHDFLYRSDSIPSATFDEANDVFLEAMKVRGKSWFIRKMMYWGVCLGGSSSYHKKNVKASLI